MHLDTSHPSLLESGLYRPLYSDIMVFKLAIATVALAAFAGAANVKRVACPDGKNFASHEAVSVSAKVPRLSY